MLAQMLRDRGFTTGGVVSAYVLRKEPASAVDSISSTTRCRRARRSCRSARCSVTAQSVGIAERWLDSISRPRLSLPPPLRTAQATRARALRAIRAACGELPTPTSCGRLVRYLKSHQLYDRSTIILLSDHGEGLGDHGEQNCLRRRGDSFTLIIKQEQRRRGTAGRRPVQHVDLVPTILDLVKAPRRRLPRPIAQARPRRDRPPGGHGGVFRGAVRAITSAGAS